MGWEDVIQWLEEWKRDNAVVLAAQETRMKAIETWVQKIDDEGCRAGAGIHGAGAARPAASTVHSVKIVGQSFQGLPALFVSGALGIGLIIAVALAGSKALEVLLK